MKFYRIPFFIFTLIFSVYSEASDELKSAVQMTTEALNKLENFKIERCDENEKDASEDQLQKNRELSTFMKKCFDTLPGFEAPSSFSDAIKLAVEFNLPPQGNMLSLNNVLEIYNVKTVPDKDNPTGQNWETKVGLFSHRMCTSIDNYFIGRNSSSKHSIILNSKNEIKKFTDSYNSIFDEYKTALKNKSSKEEIEKIFMKMKRFYMAMLSSMAKRESLSDADSHKSSKADSEQSSSFHKYFGGSGDFSRPKGVKFYYDSEQDHEISKRNIGLYQFSPTSNIDDCFTAWNNTVGKRSQACKIDFSQSRKEMNLQKFLQTAASDQIFNAFCGANKIVQSYGIQVNAKTFKNPNYSSMQLTHKENLQPQGKIKAPEDRCISPFVFSGNAFMHFGVLGFTDENNTKGVIEGTLNYLE
jgi:hypothetical protein